MRTKILSYGMLFVMLGSLEGGGSEFIATLSYCRTPSRLFCYGFVWKQCISEVRVDFVADPSFEAHGVQDLSPAQAQEDCEPGLRRQPGWFCRT